MSQLISGHFGSFMHDIYMPVMCRGQGGAGLAAMPGFPAIQSRHSLISRYTDQYYSSFLAISVYFYIIYACLSYAEVVVVQGLQQSQASPLFNQDIPLYLDILISVTAHF